MVTALVVIHGLDDRVGALRRGAVVQIRERLAAHSARQNGKAAAHRVHVETGGPIGQCYVFHRKFRNLCESGNWAIKAVSIAARADDHRHAGERIGEKREDQQALRRVAVKAAREHVKQHVGVEPAGGRAVRALDLVRMNFELRPRIDFGGGREQQPAAGLLRVCAAHCAGVDDHLAVEDDTAACRWRWRARSDGSACAGARVRDDVDAVDVPFFVADQQRIAVEGCARLIRGALPGSCAPSRRRAQS